MSKKYTATEIEERLGVKYQTANRRMKSPYAEARWGVEEEKLPDGSIRRVVPEEKLHLWENPVNYRGRPIFSKEN